MTTGFVDLFTHRVWLEQGMSHCRDCGLLTSGRPICFAFSVAPETAFGVFLKIYLLVLELGR